MTLQNKKARNQNLLLCLTISLLGGTLCAFKISQAGIGDSDFFWHNILGKYIVENKSIFEEDIFSWIAVERGYTETAHSWLGSVLVYLVTSLFAKPFYGAVAFSWVSGTAVSFAMCYAYGSPLNIENPKCDFLNCIFALLAGLSVPYVFISPRPLNIGLLLFVISMSLLHDGFDHAESKKCWWLILISVLWANVHGGAVPILFAFTGLFLVLSFIPAFSFMGIGQRKGFDLTRIKRFFGLLVGEIAAAMVNPYGYKLFIYFFYTNNETTKKYVMEWQQPPLLRSSILITLAVLIIVFFIKKREKPVEISYLLPVLATLIMTGKYIRIESYMVFCAVMLIWYIVSLYCGEEYEPKRFNTAKRGKITVLLFVCILAFSFIVCVSSANENTERAGDSITDELVEALHKINPQRLYTTYNDGGYLIYHGFKSFIDSRADLFPGDMLEKAIQFRTLSDMSNEDATKYIKEYAFDAILIAPKTPLATWLELNQDWEIVFQNDTHIIFSPANVA